MSERLDHHSPWQARVREPSLTVPLAGLLLLTFVMTPLVGLGVIGQLASITPTTR